MENGSAEDINLEYWMTNLSEQMKNMPFVYLAIPGSHDSMTYAINRTSGLAPDAEDVVRNFFFIPLVRGTIIRWTKTQDNDALQQLLIGIRYFDLRLATKQGDDKFYFTHALYAGEISGPLNQIKNFVDTHPGEVVILDFQHFYGFEPKDHLRLISYLRNLLGTSLVPRQMDLQRITLSSLHRLGEQVIVVYRNENVSHSFWQSGTMPSPWPRATNTTDLLAFLEESRRAPGRAHVHQAVITPTPRFIFLRWMYSVRSRCAIPVRNEVLPIIARDFQPGPPLPGRKTVNVVIADFVEMDDAVFPRTIIQLNSKLEAT